MISLSSRLRVEVAHFPRVALARRPGHLGERYKSATISQGEQRAEVAGRRGGESRRKGRITCVFLHSLTRQPLNRP